MTFDEIERALFERTYGLELTKCSRAWYAAGCAMVLGCREDEIEIREERMYGGRNEPGRVRVVPRVGWYDSKRLDDWMDQNRLVGPSIYFLYAIGEFGEYH